MEAKLNEFRETIAKMDQALRDAQVQYHQDKTRLEAVSNLTERYEGLRWQHPPRHGAER